MRDWEATLWPASFGGIPFFTEKRDAEYGRRLVVHEFPLRDDPFIEDLGASAVRFEVNAYLASDFADIEADALVAMLAAGGVQLLVLPSQGPVLARLKTGKRAEERDRMGYAAFTLSFFQDGGGAAVIATGLLAAVASDAVGALAGASAGFLSQVGL